MNKHINMTRIISTIALSTTAALTAALAVVPGENGIETYTEGRRGYTYIQADSPLFQENDQDRIQSVFQDFIDKCKTSEPNHAIYFNVSFEHAPLMKLLNQTGFQYYNDWFKTIPGTTERQRIGQQWIIKNNSTVPPAPSFTHTSRIAVIDLNGYVLLAQKGPTKTFFGGIADEGEDPLQTALREFEEEAGVALDQNKIMPIGTLHRTPKKDLHGLKTGGDTSFYYACLVDHKDNITLTLQEKEVPWAGWVHWSEISQMKDVGKHIKLFVEKMLNGTNNDQQWAYELPDFYTYYRSPDKEANALIWNEKMSVTFPKMPPLLNDFNNTKSEDLNTSTNMSIGNNVSPQITQTASGITIITSGKVDGELVVTTQG